MKRLGKQWFFIVAAFILALTYVSFFGVKNYYGDKEIVYFKSASDIRWDTDIQGGVEAAFIPDVENKSNITDAQLQSAKSIIETRLVNLGINDYETYIDNSSKQVVVRFPWQSDEAEFDAASAVNELGETALLTFCEGSTQEKVILSGSADIKSAQAGYNPDSPTEAVVQLELTSSGRTKFAEATARLKGSTISIWMDDNMLSNPTVNSVINNGSAIITGMSSYEEADQLANKINAGALPFALSCDDSSLEVISPTLGDEALNVLLLAGAIAFAIICILMIVLYRLPGFVACIALIGQVGGTVACVTRLFPDFNSFTLSIAGITGIILSVGMGVDANVITAERIKEEISSGKTVTAAINRGMSNSMSAIIDGNITNILVAIVLMGAFGPADGFFALLLKPFMFMFGGSVSGVIYSFGYTLLVGVIFNFIMGVFASKVMLKSLASFKAMRKPWLFGGVKNAEIV